MKIYISGKISGLKPYEYAAKFGYQSARLKKNGHDVINPVELCNCLNYGKFSYENYMAICLTALGFCDAIYMLNDWKQSPGALREHERAKELNKKIFYQGESSEIPDFLLTRGEHGKARL